MNDSAQQRQDRTVSLGAQREQKQRPITDKGGATALKKKRLFDNCSTFRLKIREHRGTFSTQQPKVSEMKMFMPSILILITVLTSATGVEEIIYAQVGDSIELKPPEGFKSRTYYLYWYLGEVELAWSNYMGGNAVTKVGRENNISLSDNTVTVRNIQPRQFATFSCKEKSSSKDEVVTFKVLKLSVSVNPPPPFLPGESLSLVCSAERSQFHREPEIHWLNPRKEKISQGSLTLTASGGDNGQWTCVVKHDEKIHTAKISVTVVDLSPVPHTVYTSKSSPLTIPCSVLSHVSWEQLKTLGLKEATWSFFPKSNTGLVSVSPQRLLSFSVEDPASWKAEHNRGLTPFSNVKRGNLSVTRNRGREDDRGDYVCSLKFKKGVNLNCTLHVNVLQIISSLGTEVIAGQQLNLTCFLGSPLTSDLHVEWFPPEQSPLQFKKSDRHPAHLVIPAVGMGYDGKWKCELWQSGAKLTSATITLKIDPKLSMMWMLVIICGAIVVIILNAIFVFILCRRRQRKIRRLRHRLCQCKNPKPKGFYRT